MVGSPSEAMVETRDRNRAKLERGGGGGGGGWLVSRCETGLTREELRAGRRASRGRGRTVPRYRIAWHAGDLAVTAESVLTHANGPK